MVNSTDILHGKILIVDDKKSTVLLLERMLRGVGYVSIESTMDPNEVCALHRKNRYDLILLDLQMPDMDGFQVMEALKEIETDGYLPVLVITAHPGHKQQAFQAGAKDFISKPFELAEVLARVSNMLEMRLLHMESKNYIKAMEQKVREVEASRDLIRRQSDEVKRLHDKIVSIEGGDAAGLAQPQAPRAGPLHTVLYVEDSPADLKMIGQLLIVRRPDIRLLTAVNGNSGIEMARVSQPEVILMDINLPDINGFKALEILQADPATAHIPVIALSANALPLNIASGLEAGFFRYLTKPLKVDELMLALVAALKNAGKESAKSTQGPKYL
ncbi:MAG: response regulator [Sideroxyarcus sp.]|nr:response regulator [Sideroxyarcus sp.]